MNSRVPGLFQTLTRSGRRPRPATTLATTEDHGLDSDVELDSDSEVDEQKATLPTTGIEEFGGVDITTDNGWDTDLEIEGQCK